MYIAGAFFLNENHNGALYLELLREVVDPKITRIVENNDNLCEDLFLFQHYCACTHYCVCATIFGRNFWSTNSKPEAKRYKTFSMTENVFECNINIVVCYTWI